MRRAAAAVLAIALLAASEPSDAQGGPYSSVAVRVAGVRATSDGALAEWWESGNGGGIELHLPFYAGEIGGFAYTLPFVARGDSQPDFRAYLVALDWRFALPAPPWVRPSVSVAAGDFLNTYDGVTAKGLAKESEIFVAATVRLDAPVTRRTAVSASFVGAQVLTSTPLRLGVATVGVSHRIAAPAWLRRVLE